MPHGDLAAAPSFLQALKNRSIAVVGAGVTGSAVRAFLDSIGATSDLIDEKAPGALAAVDRNYSLAIISPGWKRDHPIIHSLRESGAELIGEVDFAWRVKLELAPEQIWVGLTGTNGKTTTVQMVESIFTANKIHAIACGNVGVPVITAVANAAPYKYLAIELSSFQLEWSTEARYEAAALLNIAPDHIDWHGSLDAYANAKLSLLRSSNLAVINAEDPESVLRATAFGGLKVFYQLETPAPGELGLVENLLVDRAFNEDSSQAHFFAELSDITPTVPHNVSNAMAAGGLALALGIAHDDIQRGLQEFRLDRHRLELIAEQDGISWIDDSKATNTHAAQAALLSVLSSVWIAGGLAKGASMDELIARCAPRIKAAILIGQDRELIAASLSTHAPKIPFYFIEFTSDSATLMSDVVAKAKELAITGDTVLLAPACASMDQFKDYKERGDLFAKAVRELVRP
jgi:UDP-N-acetylmuramoylalanine--D-glutamate ligase